MRVWFLLVTALAYGTTAVGSADARKTYAKSLEGKQVVLKQTLFSITLPKRVEPQVGVTFITPDKGIFYRCYNVPGSETTAYTDRNPEQLVTKIVEALSRNAGYRATPYEPKLLRFETGTVMMIKNVSSGDSYITIHLADEFAKKSDDPATAIAVLWPTKFSAAFTEQAEVETLVAQLITIK